MQTEAKWCPFWQKLHFWLYTGQSILLVWRCCLPQNLHFLFPEWLFFFCYSSLLSFSFFATWLPPEIPAFSFLCFVYFFFSWSIVGFHGRRLLTDQSGQCRELYGVWGISLAEASFLYPFREGWWLIYLGLIHHQVIQTHTTMHFFVDEWRSCQRTLLNFVHKNWKYTARKQHRVSVSSGFPTQSCMLARRSSLW